MGEPTDRRKEDYLRMDLVRIEDLIRRAEESIWKEINSHRHTIYGNGSEGIKTVVTLSSQTLLNLDDKIKMLSDSFDQDKKARARKEWTMIILLLGVILEVVYTMVVK